MNSLGLDLDEVAMEANLNDLSKVKIQNLIREFPTLLERCSGSSIYLTGATLKIKETYYDYTKRNNLP
jgi:hypothetical protein